MSTSAVQRPTDPRASGLFPVGAKQSLGEYLRGIWERRSFLRSVPLADLRAQNMDTVLGNLWHLLNPLLMLGVYFLVFGVVLPDVRRGLDNFLGFLAIGIFLFQYTQRAIIQGAKSIVSNQGLIRTVTFPRAILPISSVATQTLAFVPAWALMLAFALFTGEALTASWALIIPILLLLVLFNLGGAFVAARLTNLLHDLDNVLPFVFRLLFYASGVIFPVDRFVAADSPLRWGFTANPIYSFLTLARSAIMGEPAGGGEIISAVGWSLCLLIGGFLFFRAGEREYGRG